VGAPLICVIEDEDVIAGAVAARLRAEGFDVEVAADGPAGVALCDRTRPDLVVLDLMLPGLDGLEVCRGVRAHGPIADLPVIIVSARVDELDRLLGLELGADDYVCKPFSPREVVARVRALLRRSEGRLASAPQAMQELAGGFAIDEQGQRIAWQGQVLPLTPVEYRLLRLLLGQPGRVFERARLLDQIHEEFRDVSDRVVDSHVKNIRRKLAKLAPPQDCIAAVYGVGYRFEPR